MKPLTAVLVGAGNRGRSVYAAWARRHPERLCLVAVAEPDAGRRHATADEHGIAAAQCFDDWTACLEQPRLADLAILATSDTLHVAPALAAIERGYDLLLEKPIAPTAAECWRVVTAAERAGCLLQISHVLRYTPFYRKVHEIVSSGALGTLVHLDLKEHVAAWHMTHSFVRGRFRNRAVAAPILLAKSCHDLDLMAWLADRPALRVASFGSLAHYRAEQAPVGAPARCSDGCPAQSSCPHDAVRFYLGPDDDLASFWPWLDVSADPRRAARRRALEQERYGRCVYACDNDVLDHQAVTIEFAGGLTASFSLHGFAAEEQRTLRVTGTRGELRGRLDTGLLELTRPGVFGSERYELGESPLGHFGGDVGLMEHVTGLLADGSREPLQGLGRSALEGHLLGFAAEQARATGTIVDVPAFQNRVAGV
ncbi:Gfo/Idh/MocA family oxidoreductase [Myxococcota bacterium]|nr:Gfo/Idh/MocA family oxidoreductase [Myxococcota bacterium]MCZ7620244.1 Gfo/Idh/MocA family oxidoreductase [Myxococcota bacterium]